MYVDLFFCPISLQTAETIHSEEFRNGSMFQGKCCGRGNYLLGVLRVFYINARRSGNF